MKRLTRSDAVRYMASDRTARKSVHFVCNKATRNQNYSTQIMRLGKRKLTVVTVDRGQCNWHYDENGNPVDIYGFENFKIAYVESEV